MKNLESGWWVCIETRDTRLPGGVGSEWYVFAPQGLDRLAVDAHSGQVRLTPPHERTR